MSYKSSDFRRASLPQEPVSDRFRPQVQHLQELFPSWSNEDLQSVLIEVQGDLELAATRITEGHAEQWGSVTRKKDKKTLTSLPQSASRESISSVGRERGRGMGRGRGTGRGGLPGGVGRGFAPRGGHRETNGRHASPAPGEQHVISPKPTTPSAWGTSIPGGWGGSDANATPGVDGGGTVSASASSPATGSAALGGEKIQPSSSFASSAGWDDASATEVESQAPASTIASSSGWGTETTATTWGGTDAKANGSTGPTPPTGSSSAAPVKSAKLPATSKLSWAQIAKPQEKPKPAPAPSLPPSLPPSQPDPPIVADLPPSEPEPSSQGWEEPTTVQSPTWDDEPRDQVTAPPIADKWSPEQVPSEPAQSFTEPTPPVAKVELAPEPVLSALPVQLQQQLNSAVVPSEKPLTPATHTRPSASTHRNSARYKVTDQAVVMPSSTFSTGVEKIGMQFGSLNLGGGEDTFDANMNEHSAAPELPSHVPEPNVPEVPVPAQPIPSQAQYEPPPPVSAAPPSQATPVIPGLNLFQQAIPQQVQQAQSQALQHPQQSHPASQVVHSQQQPSSQLQQPSGVTSPLQSFAQSHAQQALASHLPQQQQQQQQQQQPQPIQAQLHSYGQHGLPTHLDPNQNQAQHSPQHPPLSSQQQATVGHASYFRQPEPPYFHTPTPPAVPAQENHYGAFSGLGQQVQHQGQGSHLAGFGGSDYGYGESQRGFYEPYGQPSGFAGRNVLGHEEVKGLPGTQQPPPPSAGLPPSNSQPSQQPSQPSQGAQPQPPAGQGPQQYAPPIPYYYPPSFQNQYYGSPYQPGYSVAQPYVKYPPMYQPPGPGSAPSPATKQGPNNVGQHTNPYTQGLYTQQNASGSYDDVNYQHHNQHQHQHSHGHQHAPSSGGNLPSGEYGKHQQLYGGHGGQGIQGFMGLGQNNGPSTAPALSQRTGGASPENSYKPYAPNSSGIKDVGAGVGGSQSGVGQGQGVRAAAQQSQGAFYGARYNPSSATGGPQGQQAQQQQQQQQQHQPQNQAQQGHPGYPQGNADGNAFYPYQPRQQGYWQ